MIIYLIVTPLTFHTSFFARKLSAIAVGLVIHMLCVGLPIALVVRRYSNITDSQVVVARQQNAVRDKIIDSSKRASSRLARK